jgi:hypothetical protein
MIFDGATILLGWLIQHRLDNQAPDQSDVRTMKYSYYTNYLNCYNYKCDCYNHLEN